MTRHPRFNPFPEFTPDQSVQTLKRKCVNLYRVWPYLVGTGTLYQLYSLVLAP